ncbi:hypothetical protein [Promicromonospora sp. NPDC050249]|uniref:hypothetical protein n=1 Tax=Promicromonospora sp. NPDC050249 TaxID=3154743 RepID=UPI0033CA22A9
MAPQRSKNPPRPLAPGDVVVTWHADLGEWAAAQVTSLDADQELADVLDLDWSGPTRPETLADLGVLRPLAQQAGSWNGRLSHCHHPWVLPRSCTVLVDTFPHLTELRLHGRLGELTNASALNRLTGLRKLTVIGYFGMAAADHVTVAGAPELEHVHLHDVPREYATAMRRAWRPEAANGTYLSVTGARGRGWVAENKDNPLRD